MVSPMNPMTDIVCLEKTRKKELLIYGVMCEARRSRMNCSNEMNLALSVGA